MQKSGYLIIGCAAISVVALWSSVDNFRAPPTRLSEVRGVVSGKRCEESGRRRAAYVELEIAGSTEVYRYPDILPRARELCDRVKIGTHVALSYSTPGNPEIRGVTIEGQSFIDAQEAQSRRRSNGWVAIALAVLFLMGGWMTWRRYGFNRNF